MPIVARYVGGAGTGKTSLLMDTVEKVLQAGMELEEIGFISFTKAACEEARRRAVLRFGDGMSSMDDSWWKTLHAVCYKCLGQRKGGLLADDRDAHKWMEDACQVSFGFRDMEAEDAEDVTEGATDAAKALSAWHAARNRLEPLETARKRMARSDDDFPSQQFCEDLVNRYEFRKMTDGRCDFTDLLGMYAGYRFKVAGHEVVPPMGDIPDIRVWLLDEMQDSSPLLDAVAKRLINVPTCLWAYTMGDPFQAIFNWNGADSRLFMGWKVDRQKVLPKSYRCGRPILELGEQILRGCSDYWDRGIAPADHESSIAEETNLSSFVDEIDPTQSWMLLARSNWHCKRLSAVLNREGIPWRPIKGYGGWSAPTRQASFATLSDLEQGYPVNWKEWKKAVKMIPSAVGGTELLVRGTKLKWEGNDYTPEPEIEDLKLADLDKWGGTEALKEMIATGNWTTVNDKAHDYRSAVSRWGHAAANEPKVVVGTVHSSKGMESDHVAYLTTTSSLVSANMEYQDGVDEELRLAYVAVTRARYDLRVINERKQRHKIEIDL